MRESRTRGLPSHLRVRKVAPNGKLGCRYCGGDLPGAQWSYCSPECRHEFRLLNEFDYAKVHVLLRDLGVCAACGRRTMDGVLVGTWRLEPSPRYNHSPVTWRVRNAMGLFECDHVVEVALGGTNELSNLQTLCPEDHARKTARFAAERALERRLSKNVFRHDDEPGYSPERP